MNLIKKTILGTAITAASLGFMIAPAFAAPPGLAVNPGNQQSASSNNCIAIYSAQVIHNGQHITLGQGGDPSHGTRGDEIKGLQALCNNANQ